MDTVQVMVLLGIGLFAGVVSALMGVGGGIVVVPLLTMFVGMTQKGASATSLAMLLPPIGIFAVLEYYQKGMIDVRVAGILAVPFAIGALVGAKYVMPHINEAWLRPMFSSLLVYAAVMTVLKGPGRERAVILAGAGALGWWTVLFLLRMLGRRWEQQRASVQKAYMEALTKPRDEVGAGI
jgi:uncharacterized membrane protein YfcA